MSIVARISRGLHARRQVREFLQLPAAERSIVFYAEDDYSFMHFEGLIARLTNEHGRHVCYLTSQYDDPIFTGQNSRVRPFYVGSGWHRTALFLKMNAGVVIMTMPDLETYHLKRSRVAEVHYLYVFHAMVSTHSNYRERAFDHYDSIFLTGPYQRDEIRATELAYGLPEKTLVEYGYPRLERLIDDARAWRGDSGAAPAEAMPRVILAPSWGPNSILESIGVEVVAGLLEAGLFVTVRPHPVTTQKRPDVIEQLRQKFGTRPGFQLETDIRDKATLYQADLMICDWSGVAMEYAFSCERPVLFIDVPKKSNNPNSERIGLTPIETSIRAQIGAIIAPDDLSALPDAVMKCVREQSRYVEKIRELRSSHVFNLHRSEDVGALFIRDLADRLEARPSG